MGETAHAERGAAVWRRATGTAYVEPAGRVVVLDLDHADLPPYLLEGSATHICPPVSTGTGRRSRSWTRWPRRMCVSSPTAYGSLA
jgi:hypothetical protein